MKNNVIYEKQNKTLEKLCEYIIIDVLKLIFLSKGIADKFFLVKQRGKKT